MFIIKIPYINRRSRKFIRNKQMRVYYILSDIIKDLQKKKITWRVSLARHFFKIDQLFLMSRNRGGIIYSDRDIPQVNRAVSFSS